MAPWGNHAYDNFSEWLTAPFLLASRHRRLSAQVAGVCSLPPPRPGDDGLGGIYQNPGAI